MATLKLEPHELESPVCKKVQAYLEAELKEQREKNDELTQAPEVTAAIRGRIKLLKDTLNMIDRCKRPGPGPA